MLKMDLLTFFYIILIKVYLKKCYFCIRYGEYYVKKYRYKPVYPR